MSNTSLQLVDVELTKMNFLKKDVQDGNTDKPGLKNISLLSIKDISEDTLKICNYKSLSMNAVHPFSLEMEIVGTFKGENLNKDEINKNIEDIAYPLLAKSSYITSFITEQFLNHPVITPPAVEAAEASQEEQ